MCMMIGLLYMFWWQCKNLNDYANTLADDFMNLDTQWTTWLRMFIPIKRVKRQNGAAACNDGVYGKNNVR